MLRGVDYSVRLRQLGIDIVSLGHFDEVSPSKGSFSQDFDKLPKQQQTELRRVGLFDENFPRWTVVITHHWQQTFPAHKILQVRHEYAPVVGEEVTVLDDLINKKAEKRHLVTFAQSCINPPLQKTIAASMQKADSSWVKWVDYILTTANTWKKPIKQFELIVERPKPDNEANTTTSAFAGMAKSNNRTPIDSSCGQPTSCLPKSSR